MQFEVFVFVITQWREFALMLAADEGGADFRGLMRADIVQYTVCHTPLVHTYVFKYCVLIHGHGYCTIMTWTLFLRHLSPMLFCQSRL